MSALQDRFASFLRDRAAADMVRSVKEELFPDVDHDALDSALDDGLAQFYQEVVNAAQLGDWDMVVQVLGTLQEGSLAIGYAFRELELDRMLRDEVA